ncbi:hypothetical protein CBR_g4402 [Chara braunii]|nr:hypothetical protein CBR_g4402 [Chara braunii]|eukprot:GBG69569.1 hypothetical protein CBR_g4402 [Chara braunii]
MDKIAGAESPKQLEKHMCKQQNASLQTHQIGGQGGGSMAHGDNNQGNRKQSVLSIPVSSNTGNLKDTVTNRGNTNNSNQRNKLAVGTVATVMQKGKGDSMLLRPEACALDAEGSNSELSTQGAHNVVVLQCGTPFSQGTEHHLRVIPVKTGQSASSSNPELLLGRGNQQEMCGGGELQRWAPPHSVAGTPSNLRVSGFEPKSHDCDKIPGNVDTNGTTTDVEHHHVGAREDQVLWQEPCRCLTASASHHPLRVSKRALTEGSPKVDEAKSVMCDVSTDQSLRSNNIARRISDGNCHYLEGPIVDGNLQNCRNDNTGVGYMSTIAGAGAGDGDGDGDGDDDDIVMITTPRDSELCGNEPTECVHMLDSILPQAMDASGSNHDHQMCSKLRVQSCRKNGDSQVVACHRRLERSAGGVQSPLSEYVGCINGDFCDNGDPCGRDGGEGGPETMQPGQAQDSSTWSERGSLESRRSCSCSQNHRHYPTGQANAYTSGHGTCNGNNNDEGSCMVDRVVRWKGAAMRERHRPGQSLDRDLMMKSDALEVCDPGQAVHFTWPDSKPQSTEESVSTGVREEGVREDSKHQQDGTVTKEIGQKPPRTLLSRPHDSTCSKLGDCSSLKQPSLQVSPAEFFPPLTHTSVRSSGFIPRGVRQHSGASSVMESEPSSKDGRQGTTAATAAQGDGVCCDHVKGEHRSGKKKGTQGTKTGENDQQA